MEIALFKEITTEDALQVLEKESAKWTDLYCDMDQKEERKFVKDSSKTIEDIRKKVERARIDKSKDYKARVEAEAKSIDARLVAANKPFISLIDAHKEKRAKILLAEKEKLEAEELIIKKENDHEFGLMMNDKFDRDIEEAKQAQILRDEQIRQEATAKAEAEKLRAEEAAKQAIIDQKAAEQLAEQQRLQSIEDAKAGKQAADKAAEQAAETARLAEIKRQNDEAERVEAERLKVEANKKHVGLIRKGIKEQIMKNAGIDEAKAIKVVKSMLKIERITIDYL